MTALAEASLAADARAGLWADPPTLPPRWLYDERGSRLFDEITRLPEYYPTRREAELLTVHSDEIARSTRARTLVELGSGTSEKTRLLLDALAAAGSISRFVPLDVSVEVLTTAAMALRAAYPGIEVEPVAASFTTGLHELPRAPGPVLMAFLGGTIGNLDPAERSVFFDQVRNALHPGDWFLLGVDLLKSPARLLAAYDDVAGVTADFNRNLIEVLRSNLAAQGLYADDFDHVARWNAKDSRIELWLRARRDVHAYFGVLGRSWNLAAGQAIRTEISTKFELPRLSAELAGHALVPVHAWTDADADYAVVLSVLDRGPAE